MDSIAQYMKNVQRRVPGVAVVWKDKRAVKYSILMYPKQPMKQVMHMVEKMFKI